MIRTLLALALLVALCGCATQKQMSADRTAIRIIGGGLFGLWVISVKALDVNVQKQETADGKARTSEDTDFNFATTWELEGEGSD